MKILCLFDGAGLARLGLEQAGHRCTGVELDPWKHYLSCFVGSGNCILSDATKVDVRSYDAVWASPPCQSRSSARTKGDPIGPYARDHLQWCLNLKVPVLWVENVRSQTSANNLWGTLWNFAQLDPQDPPRQSRNRVVGGRHLIPPSVRPYRKSYEGVCPCITASEIKGTGTDRRRASRFYGRKLTPQECAWHQGLEMPEQWLERPDHFTRRGWEEMLYNVVGNGVPVWATRAFGGMYK